MNFVLSDRSFAHFLWLSTRPHPDAWCCVGYTRYTYVPRGRTTEEYLLYIWQGRESSQDEKGASALLAVSLDDEYGGRPVQVRVEQGKEPDHMVAIFNGKMVVHKGGKASGFKNKAAEDTYDTDGVSLFHVRGTSPANTRSVQVEEVSSMLNSVRPSATHLWRSLLSCVPTATHGDELAI